MLLTSIITTLKPLIKNKRILETLAYYVLMIILPLDKHSQKNAATISGKNDSLFSNLLSGNVESSRLALNRASRRVLANLVRKRGGLVKKATWTISIIIDATLHKRSSGSAQNSQKFNHGKGWSIGHQWTNIGFLINDTFIPLPPIAFYTREECKRRDISYKTEHEKIAELLRTLSLKTILGIDVPASEVVVMLDAGYDCKEIQSIIIARKWDFISSLKSSRKIASYTHPLTFINIANFFKDGRRPWKSIRIFSYRGKKKILRQYGYKQLAGYLKGVHRQVKLVCSKRSRDKKMKFLACSNKNVTARTIIQTYGKRWKIELFHRDIKSFLGLEDAGVRSFDSLHNHVHWVYVAYIMIKEKFPNHSIQAGQALFEQSVRVKTMKATVQQLTLVNGGYRVKCQQQSAIEFMEKLIAA